MGSEEPTSDEKPRHELEAEFCPAHSAVEPAADKSRRKTLEFRLRM